MARIRASCATCGDVELTVPDVQVRICTNTDEGTYSFRCPTCTSVVTKEAERRTLDLLAASGTEVVYWSLPRERLVSAPGQPLSHDDVIDFHLLLKDDDMLAEAIGTLVDD